jgi:hypothetical protein
MNGMRTDLMDAMPEKSGLAAGQLESADELRVDDRL